MINLHDLTMDKALSPRPVLSGNAEACKAGGHALAGQGTPMVPHGVKHCVLAGCGEMRQGPLNITIQVPQPF